MATFIEGLVERFVTDALKGVAAEKLEHQSSPDVKFNSVAPLPLNNKTAHSLCSNKSMEGAFTTLENHVCAPSALPLFVDSTLEINEHVLEQKPSSSAHETTLTTNLTAPLNTCVSKETEISVCSGSTKVLDTAENFLSPKYSVRTHADIEVNAHPFPYLVHLSVCNARFGS